MFYAAAHHEASTTTPVQIVARDTSPGFKLASTTNGGSLASGEFGPPGAFRDQTRG
jgi:hypothetical protein